MKLCLFFFQKELIIIIINKKASIKIFIELSFQLIVVIILWRLVCVFLLQDALRLYLINSPVVRAETLRFKKEGVFGVVSLYWYFTLYQVFSVHHLGTMSSLTLTLLHSSWTAILRPVFPHFDFMDCWQVRDVFLPWYNAYRFLVQNAKRLEIEGFAPFSPVDQATLQKSFNVLDQWINSATQSLVYFVRKEMDGYRLYTVRHFQLIYMAPIFSWIWLIDFLIIYLRDFIRKLRPMHTPQYLF